MPSRAQDMTPVEVPAQYGESPSWHDRIILVPCTKIQAEPRKKQPFLQAVLTGDAPRVVPTITHRDNLQLNARPASYVELQSEKFHQTKSQTIVTCEV